MIDPKTYWNCRKAQVAVTEPEIHLRPLSVAVSKERLPGGCILYRIEWGGYIDTKQFHDRRLKDLPNDP